MRLTRPPPPATGTLHKKLQVGGTVGLDEGLSRGSLALWLGAQALELEGSNPG